MTGERVDEASRRRDTFRPGRAVELADGQEWQLPIPEVVMFPRGDSVAFESDLGPEFDRFLAAYHSAKLLRQMYEAILLGGRHLLLANYRLDDREVAGLLRVPYRESTFDSPIVTALRDLVEGVGGPRNPTDG